MYSKESSSEDFEMLKQRLNDRWIQYQAVKLMKTSWSDLCKSNVGQSDMVQKLQTDFIKLDNMDADTYSRTVSLLDGMPEAWAYINQRRDNPEEVPGIMTGIQAIDNVYKGLTYGSYTAISGLINGGKTTLMFNIGFNMARAGHSVVYVSLEKEAVPMIVRLLSLHALVDYNRIKRGGTGDKGMPDNIYRRLENAKKDLEETVQPNMEFIQLPLNVTLTKIISEIEKIKAQKKVDVVVVDYLGVIGFETHTPGRPDLDLANVSKRLQSYGRVNRFVTITAVQLKNQSTKEIRGQVNKSAKKGKEEGATQVQINTEDIGGTQSIMADAENSLGVWLNADEPPTMMHGFITKARDDQSRVSIEMDFDGRLGRVCDCQLESGHIKAVDDLVYNKSITAAELESSDNLFSSIDDAEKISPAEQLSSAETEISTESEPEVDFKPEGGGFDFVDEAAEDAESEIEEKAVATPASVSDELDFLA
jgi:replicative DNA helicase